MTPLPVLEFYGLPGAGKSTIAAELTRLLEEEGLRVGTRGLISEWIEGMTRREKLRFRTRAALRMLSHPACLWAYCAGVRPLQPRRYFLLFMKAEAVSRLRARGAYDVLVLDQWLLQDLWSLLVLSPGFPASLPSRLWAAASGASRICHVSVPAGVAAGRLAGRTHGLSRFDGMDPAVSLSRLTELESFTDGLLSGVMAGQPIGIDGRIEARINAQRLAAQVRSGAEKRD